MIVGVMSDTHGRRPAALAAAALLQRHGAAFLVHCGDVGGPDVLDALVGVPSAFVFGNTDWERTDLRRYADQLGVRCLDAFGELELGGKRLAVLHGDDFRVKKQLIDRQQHDYLLFGHTHVPERTPTGRLTLVNPGALHRARPKTVALLDLAAGEVQFLEVDVP